MAENLRYEGNIRLGVGNSTSSTIAYRYYPNGISGNISTYGYLYNWPAVMNGMSSSTANPIGVKGICPNGWHLPSDAEWRQLVDFLGDPEAAGAMLAGKPNLWEGGGLVSSSYFGITGFNALPAGYCHDPNYSSWFGINAGFWSATESDIWRAYSINIYNDNAGVSIGVDYKEYGYNVRCLRDE